MVEPALAGLGAVCICCAGADFFSAWVGNGHIARHTLLQQQLAGLNHWLAVEALAHLAAMQGIGDGDDAHALMVGHKVAHDGEWLTFR